MRSPPVTPFCSPLTVNCRRPAATRQWHATSSTVGDAFSRFGKDDGAADNALRSALATIDIAASAIIVGTEQTGRIRANRHYEGDVVQALEDDVTDPSDAHSTTAVLDKVSAASLIRARQQETRVELLSALTEQLLVESKRERDTEAAAMNMQLGRLTRGRAVAASLRGGSRRGLPDVAAALSAHIPSDR